MQFDEFRKTVALKFNVDTNRYVIAKLKKIPEFSNTTFAIIQDKNEITAILHQEHGLQVISEKTGFKLITFNVGLPFNLIGFLAHVSNLLANVNISLFAISAYSTDHILVKEKDVTNAINVLQGDGILFIETRSCTSDLGNVK
jgi:hypothetical protein